MKSKGNAPTAAQKRWMVLKKLKPDEYEIKPDFPFWDSGNVDWYEDYFYDRGVYANS